MQVVGTYVYLPYVNLQVTIQLLHERGWRGSLGLLRQSRDERLAACLFI